ncbi:hypothetical protein EXS57_01490 [Candidatus Kaiserbacteria bacterium]|nr:hypothetical protein [Candidatus Kaiserbacteria bacterium]
MNFSFTTNWLKIALGFTTVFLFRLIPFRLPNVEPLLATVMPFSKRLGAVGTFFFGFFGIVLFDAVTSGWGIWTLVTALAYGALGFASHFYFNKRAASVKNFVTFGIVGTLFYDAVTGLTIGPLFQGQSFMVALVGQIPFTLLHLAGTVVFATFLSPALYRWVVENKRFELSFLKNRVVV